MVAALATAFVVVEAVDVAVLTRPRARIESAGPGAALVALALLVADALVPVASSLVMISLGAFYGAPMGIALAWLGRFAMALVGFAIGRRGGPLVARVVGDAEKARADALLERHGALAIVVSRPVPLVAEAVTVMAGASTMSWRRAAIAAAVGSLPEAVVYGLAGGISATFRGGAFVWIGFLIVASVLWLAERRVSRNGRAGGRRQPV